MPFQRRPSAESGGVGFHHAIAEAGGAAAAIPGLRRGRGAASDRCREEKKGEEGPAPRIYFSLSPFPGRGLLRALARDVAGLLFGCSCTVKCKSLI